MQTAVKHTLFPILIILFPFSMSFPSDIYESDTTRSISRSVGKYPGRKFHFAFAYGKAYYNTRRNVISAFVGSGYPYHVISNANPSASAGQPVVYSFTIEKNVTNKVFIGLHYAAILNKQITGSNWVGAIQNNKPIPIERFDVAESYSSKFVNWTFNFIPVPINLVDSRFELTIGGGISYNMLHVSGMQRFERHPPYYNEIFDDTTAAFKFKKNDFGVLFAGSIDFYWSGNVSNQFKLEFRSIPALKVSEQTLTYVTTRNQIRVIDTQVLKKHSLSNSRIILSISLRFHI